MTEVIWMLHLGRDYWRSGRHLALLALGIMASMLMRNNGKYVIYPMVLLLLIVFFLRYQKTGVLRRAVLALLLPVLAANLIQSGLMRHYDIEKGSIREALSLPIQQTARYVLERGDEVTAEEKAAIAAVLDYDNMARDYYPMESDPVKDAERAKEDAERAAREAEERQRRAPIEAAMAEITAKKSGALPSSTMDAKNAAASATASATTKSPLISTVKSNGEAVEDTVAGNNISADASAEPKKKIMPIGTVLERKDEPVNYASMMEAELNQSAAPVPPVAPAPIAS